MDVELLMFPGCPHVDNARAQLRRALGLAGLSELWRERDISLPGTPTSVAAMGSPTILVHGVDVAGAQGGTGLSCRVYPKSELTGAPPLDAIVAALRASPATAPGPSRPPSR